MRVALWGHGYGNKRHLVDRSSTGWRTRATNPPAACTPTIVIVRLSDDMTPTSWKPGPTVSAFVMSLPPCRSCCKRAGLNPEEA